MPEDKFQASWWLPGGHAQTVWPVLTRRVPLEVRSERMELPDGDFVQLDWIGADGPIVIVLPGLQGDLGSAYVRGLLRACQARGWRGVLLNYRGRVEPNRFRQSYHCGMTCDLHYLAHHLAQRGPATPIGVVGCSVGANICLKWLGECGRRGESLPIVAAAGVSVPFNLGAVAKKIERGFSRVYQWHLLRSLRGDVARKRQALGDPLGISRRELRRLNTFFRFDDRISGPWNGFCGAEDYYAKTRSDVLLKHVAVPDADRQRQRRSARAGPPGPAPARSLREGDAGDHPRRRASRFRLRPMALVAAVLARQANTGVLFVVLPRQRWKVNVTPLHPDAAYRRVWAETISVTLISAAAPSKTAPPNDSR